MGDGEIVAYSVAIVVIGGVEADGVGSVLFDGFARQRFEDVMPVGGVEDDFFFSRGERDCDEAENEST